MTTTLPTIAILGCGNRGGRAYGAWCAENPDRVRVTAIADPDLRYRSAARDLLGLPESACFDSWEDLLARPRLADGLVIALTEDMRLEPLQAAVEKGYQVLIEKPLARSAEELAAMDAVVSAHSSQVVACHVLRYQPFFAKVKELVAGGAVGRVVHIQHNENMGYWHFTHSYVRGIFRNQEKAGPVILAKTSHDLDIIGWLADSPADRVSSLGRLTHFHEGHAPEGAPPRCLDGCPVFDTCAHNAKTFYVDELGSSRDWPVSMVEPVATPEARLAAIQHGPYGRCVYRCDNTQPDQQITTITFANGVTATLTASAFTAEDTRTFRIFGTEGEMLGHMHSGHIEVRRFAGAETGGVRPFGKGEMAHHVVETTAGHTLGDAGLMAAFVDVLNGTSDDPTTSWSRSVESQWMAFAAERSRSQDSAWIPLSTLRH